MDYEVTTQAVTPILIHGDHVVASDEVKAWQKDPKNKSVSVPGDDRSPPWTWQTYLYTDGKHLVIPHTNIMTSLRTAGAKVPAAKGRGSFKGVTQSGLMITSDYAEFFNRGKKVPVDAVVALRNLSFRDQVEGARALGFELDVRRARVGDSKHVRVRAKFEDWSCRFRVMVTEPAITAAVLEQLFEIAGRQSGLGDYRPSAPKSPGSYGMFTARVTPVPARKSA